VSQPATAVEIKSQQGDHSVENMHIRNVSVSLWIHFNWSRTFICLWPNSIQHINL